MTKKSMNNDLKTQKTEHKDDGAKIRRNKVFFLSKAQLADKKRRLEDKLREIEGTENKRKRLNVFKMLGKVNKAIENPEEFVKDPGQEKARREMDKIKRVSKKLERKQITLEEKKRDRNRERSQHCLYCKKYGHTLKECTEKKGDANDGICYNCGSNEHRLDYCTQERSRELPFANCFVCGEVGHLSKNCLKNPNGIFFKGGGCYFCGSKEHLKRDCDEFTKVKQAGRDARQQQKKADRQNKPQPKSQ